MIFTFQLDFHPLYRPQTANGQTKSYNKSVKIETGFTIEYLIWITENENETLV